MSTTNPLKYSAAPGGSVKVSHTITPLDSHVLRVCEAMSFDSALEKQAVAAIKHSTPLSNAHLSVLENGGHVSQNLKMGRARFGLLPCTSCVVISIIAP
jgi:hypothetical protein